MTVNRFSSTCVVPGSITTGRTHEAQTGLQGTGAAAAQGREAAFKGCASRRGGAKARGCAPERRRMGAHARGKRKGRSEAAQPRPAAASIAGAVRRAWQDARRRRPRAGLRHGALDAAAGREAHQAALRHRILHGPHLASAAPTGLFLPEARAARYPARRGGDRALEAAALAGAKKNAAARGQTIVFIDESGLSERPTVARTWAPKGKTPVLQYSFNWKQISAIAGLTFWRFYFRFFPGTIRAPQLVEFLQGLRTQLRGRRAL